MRGTQMSVSPERPDISLRLIPDDQQTVMPAHELQHAVEIAGAGEAVDQRSMLPYYMRIGIELSYGTATIRAFETAFGSDHGRIGTPGARETRSRGSGCRTGQK